MFQAPALPPTVVLHVRSRWSVVFGALFLAVSLGFFAWLAAMLVSQSGVAGAVSAVVVALGVTWGAARAWSERVELHGDHLLHWRGDRSTRISFDELTAVDLLWFDATRAYQMGQPLTVTLRRSNASPLAIQTRYEQAAPLVDAVTDALAARMRGRIERGETLTFADANSFPFVATLAFGFFALCVLGVMATVFTGHEHYRPGQYSGMGVTLVAFASFAYASLKTWWKARRTRGLALSSAGLQPLAELGKVAPSAAGLRSDGAVGAWIPWDAVLSARINGAGVELQTSARPEPIVLSAKTEHLVTMHRMLTRAIEHRGRAAV